MTSSALYQIFESRLNRMSTNAGQNVSLPQFVIFINKAQQEWLRQRIKISERTSIVSEDLQVILTGKEINTTKVPGLSGSPTYFKAPIPSDFYHTSRMTAKVTIDNPSEVQRKQCTEFDVILRQVEDGNLMAYMGSEMTKPSSAWGEGLFTISDNLFKVYVDGSIKKVFLSYYKTPPKIDIAGYTINGVPSVNVDPVFSNPVCLDIVDLAVAFALVDLGDLQKASTIMQQRGFQPFIQP